MRQARGLVTALVLAFALPLHAAEHDKRVAAAHFRAGKVLYDQGRFDEALSEFQSGYQTYPLPGFLVNIGQCYRKLDRLDEAADAFQKFLDSNPPDELRSEVADALSEVKNEQARRAAEEREKQQAEAAAEHPLPPIAQAPPPETSIDTAPAAPVAAPLAVQVQAPPPVVHHKRRAWVWALVGVAAAGAVAAAVTVGVVETQPQGASLGVIDGRR